MKRNRGFLLAFLLALSPPLAAQERAAGGFGPSGEAGSAPRLTVTGKVVDGSNSNALEYATVILLSARDGKQVTGGVTDKTGRFALTDVPPGRFKMVVQYMGFKKKTVDDVAPQRGASGLDVGTVRLEPTVLKGEGVEVQADKPEFEYKIDKRVINVGQQHTALSGTAVDVLENVPSITVDVDNNVSLRGSANFTVLIDNRPTPLDPNQALQQTPASTIDQIEIITNPSAKYEPDGSAGIINIVTKKTAKGGITGIGNLNLGLDDIENRHGADFLLNYRKSAWTAYIGLDYNKRQHPGTTHLEHRVFQGDTTYFRYSDGDALRGGKHYGLRAGADWSPTAADVLSLGLRAGGHSFGGETGTRYDEWTEPGPGHTRYRSEDAMDRGGDFSEVNLDWKHDFGKAGHELLVQAILENETSDEEETNALYSASDSLTQGQRTTEDGPERDFRFKADYTLPLRQGEKVQAGWQTRAGSSSETLRRYDYQAASGLYEFQAPYSHASEHDRTIHSLYGMYANEFGKLGVQGGLRGEYTGREIRVTDTDQKFSIDRWDVFPTFHASYTFAQGRQAMASYTRRIQRPRDWFLEPFETWMDAYNVRRGNPDLKPELIDSYEAAFQTQAGPSLFSVEAYYRVTHDKMDMVRSVYAPRVSLHTMANTGMDYSLGTEVMVNVNPLKPWNVNLMGNLFQYRVEGSLLGEEFERESFNWSLRFNNTLRIGKATRFQANGRYNSASVSAQGEREDEFMVDFGLRQEFFNRALSATLQVRDAFKTGLFEGFTEGPDFHTYHRFTRQAPVYTLTLTFNINNYKREQTRENGMENGENGGGEGESIIY